MKWLLQKMLICQNLLSPPSRMYFYLNKTVKRKHLKPRRIKTDPAQDLENSRIIVKSVIGFLLFIPDCLSSSFIPVWWNWGKCVRFATGPAELWCEQALSSPASILSPFTGIKFMLTTKFPSKKPQIIRGNHHRGIPYPVEDLAEN